ncbi:hypothetical protein E4U52_001124 [Claviceps spartinae]|nr:hypothetical protein E4U52_001124 [Claviceps spartinae]
MIKSRSTLFADIVGSINHVVCLSALHEPRRFEKPGRTSCAADPAPLAATWDGTQPAKEPVFAWAKYFSNEDLQQKALNSIRGYMPTVAHWGWNGNARRCWDFIYGGKLGLLERMIHHYGSSLNALPLLTSYRYNRDPSSATVLYDLRVGYGGIMDPLSNINAEGFASTAFHSYPNRLKWDGYSGDYGPNYVGVIMGSCTYLVQHPDFGWISMGGNVAPSSNNDVIVVEPRDTVRRSIYAAAMGLSVTFGSGVITSFAYEPQEPEQEVDYHPASCAGGYEDGVHDCQV